MGRRKTNETSQKEKETVKATASCKHEEVKKEQGGNTKKNKDRRSKKGDEQVVDRIDLSTLERNKQVNFINLQHDFK
jgi:hypothetical protein